MKAIVAAALLIFSLPTFSAEPTKEELGISQYQSLSSPSRKFIALSGIGIADVSPSARFRLRILVVDILNTQTREILTWLRSPWEVIWSPKNVLLVCGRQDNATDTEPLVVLAYEVERNAIIRERAATDDEKTLVLLAHQRKHGTKPKS